MSQMRQNGISDRSGDLKSAIATLARDYPAGHVIPLHFHDRDQLVYASRGVMTVRTRDGTWVVPPHRAVWIPAEFRTRSRCRVGGDANAVSETKARKRTATRLLRDQCLNTPQGADSPRLYLRTLKKSVKWQMHLVAVILHQLEAVQTIPLQLPHLSDPRLVRIAEILMSDPRDSRTLAQLCKGTGAGKRSVERLFQQEVGMTFGKWRQQLRLMQGMRL